MLKDMFEAIDRFESDQITEQEVIRQFDLLFSCLDNNATGAETTAALQAELEDFLSGEIRHEGTEEFENTSISTILFLQQKPAPLPH